MDALVSELKVKVVDTLNLPDVTPADIDETEQLVGGKLGIDSIDVLELVMMVEKEYAVKIDSKELGAKVFANLQSLADYISRNAAERLN
jgi:acyl carrier protein